MKALIKDLEYKAYQLNDVDNTPLHYTIRWLANVVIKRDGEFYEVPIHMTEDVDLDDNLLEALDRAFVHFEKHCDLLSANWKIVEEDLEGTYGKVIAQRKIKL